VVYLLSKIPAILYSLLIYFLSSIPQQNIPPIRLLDFDKFLHLIEYLLYGCTLVLAFARSKSEKIAANSTMLSIITGILYAISDEVHQIWVPGRDCNLFDFIADATGLLIGIFLFQKLLHYRLEKEDLIYQKTSHK
jgi:VanZ family protein